MPEGGDSKENLIFLRIVAHTIAVLYHCTKAKEDFVMGNGNLKGGRRQEVHRSFTAYSESSCLLVTFPDLPTIQLTGEGVGLETSSTCKPCSLKVPSVLPYTPTRTFNPDLALFPGQRLTMPCSGTSQKNI